MRTPFIQIAAAEVLDAGLQITEKMINEYQSRRDLLVDGLNTIRGIRCGKSEGTFYAFANIKSISSDSESFSKITKRTIYCNLSRIYFGENGEGFVRFALQIQNRILMKLLKD